MRNLKRALSLGVTAAMISGLMVMGSSAAGYADVTSEQNEEAIEVLQTIGIMIGDESGNFNPDQNVTRNQMAVIMANLMEYNVANYRDTSPFTDVPSWAEPYVAACYTNGITSGYSATIYGGEDSVTTAQAALMLMKALGYFQYASDFGSDWQLATLKQGNNIDLFIGVDSRAEDPLTRNDVAQLVLNTLEAGTVQASTEGSWTIGDVTVTSGVQYDYITSNQPYASAIDDKRTTNNDGDLVSGSIVELGEQLYMGDLKLNDSTSDDFMRPSRTWSYNGSEIGTYVKKDLVIATYTKGVTGREMYDLLTSSTVREYGMDVYKDGVTGDFTKAQVTRSNDNTLEGTGNGVLTEVFLDLDEKEVTITSINTWLAKANSDYNVNSETLSLKVYDEQTDGSNGYTQVIDNEDVAGIEDIVKDQFVLVNMSKKDRDNYEIVAMSDPQILSNATVTKFSTKGDGDKVNKEESLFNSLTVDGNKYDAAKKAYYDEDVLNLYDQELLTDNTYNVFVDPYGYAIGVELYEGSKNYVFIAGYDMNSSNIAVRTADAAAIFMDGTMATIEVNVTNTNKNIDVNGNKNYSDDYDKYDAWSDNHGQNGEYAHNLWYTYTEADGVYTLRPVGDENMLVTTYASYDQTINCSNVWVQDNTAPNATDIRGYGNDDSVYITVEPGDVTNHTDGAITDVTGLYTGVQNVEIILENEYKKNVPNDIYTVTDKNQYIIASVVLGEAQGSTANYAYILDPVISEERLEDGTYLWEFEAVLGGTIQTLTARSKYQDVITVLRQNDEQVVELRFDGDYVVDAKPVDKDVITFTQGIDEKTDEVFDVTTGMNTVPNPVDLYLEGRTLHTGARSTGLTFVSDAPTVLRQEVRGKDKTVEYGSVDEAYSNLGDANTLKDGLQFSGRIVAVLNNQGVAEWVFIDSNTPAEGSTTGGGFVDGSYNTNLYISGGRYCADYYGGMTLAQVRDQITKAAENYFDRTVTQCEVNLATGTAYVLFDGSMIPYQIDLYRYWIVTGDNSRNYYPENTTTVKLTPNAEYLASGTAAVASSDSKLLTADASGNVTIPSLTADITLVNAYKVEVASGMTAKASNGVTASGTSPIYVAASSANVVTVEVTGTTQGSDQFVQFMNGTTELTEAQLVKSGNPLKASVIVNGDLNITEKAGTLVKVDGETLGLFTGSEDLTWEAKANGLGYVYGEQKAAVVKNVMNSYELDSTDLSSMTSVPGNVVNGVLEIKQAAQITTAANVTVAAKQYDGTTALNIAASRSAYVTVGQQITVSATSIPSGQTIQVSYDGGSTWKDLEVADGATSVTFRVPDNYGAIQFQIG